MRLLYVCMGNICRSPSAENVMRSLIEKAGLSDKIEVDSAGTINYHTGNPPDSRMTAAATAREIPMTGRARQVKANDLRDFDWIFVMDHENKADIDTLASELPADEINARIVLFCDFCTEHPDTIVPDPYYGGPEGFEKVLDLLEDGCAGFLASPHVTPLTKTG